MRRVLASLVVCAVSAASFAVSGGVGGAAWASRKSDKAKAKAAILTLSDFPAGWRETSANAGEADRARADISACKFDRKRHAQAAKQPHADSPAFNNGNAYASSTVTIFPSVKSARAAMSKFADHRTANCLKATTEKIASDRLAAQGSSATLDGVDVGKLSVPSVGDEALGAEVVIRFSASGLTSAVYSDNEVIRVGRAVASLVFQDSGSPFGEMRSGLTSAVLSRLPGSPSGGSATSTTKPNSGLSLGSTAQTPSGNKVTVYSYEQPASGIPEYQTPDAGTEFVAVDVEGCATGGQSASLNPFNFELQMPDNTRQTETFGKSPALHATDLNAGDCVRGWITFQVPTGQRASFVVFDTGGSASSGATQLKWAVG